MAIEKITNTTVLGEWPTIINAINDATVTNANSIVNSIGSVYSFEQEINESFDDALNRFKEDNSIVFKKNDVAVVKIMGTDYDGNRVVMEQAAYTHDGNAFVACTGAVDADKVIMRQDIKLAGEYTAVGNIKKSSTTATADFSAKGKSVADILVEMLSKRVDPTKTNPSIGTFSFNNVSTSVEAGTTFSSIAFKAVSFNDGKYTNSETTGSEATAWNVKRIFKKAGSSTEENASVSVSGTATQLAAWSDTNGDKGFQIGDKAGFYGEGEDNPVLSSLKYSLTASYSDGDYALDNLGGVTEVKITAGTTSAQTTSAISCYRNYFYGAVTTSSAEAPIDGAFIRTLTKSGKAYASGATTPEVVAGSSGAKRMIFACVATAAGPSSIPDNTSFHADNKDNFKKMDSTVLVAGANGYEPIAYNVWVYEPAKPFEAGVGFSFKLG